MSKVFVYGTLKSGGTIRGLSGFGDGAVIVGKAKTTYPDYKMVDLGSFPGVLMGGTNYIQGEVWEVTDDVAEQLDAIEGYPDFYNKIPTETTEGKAMMYFLPKEYEKYPGPEASNNITTEGDILIWNNG
tara:strand:- start:6 stop:392 length:387 start_codon:yes stop_codon:yes gene_type:complete